jgi:hypothetical protein
MPICFYHYWSGHSCWKYLASNRGKLYAIVYCFTRHQEAQGQRQRKVDVKNASGLSRIYLYA